MRVNFAQFAFERSGLGLPPTRQTNLLFENTPGGPFSDSRLSRWGLATAFTVGFGPVVGLFAKRGVFNADIFTVSGKELYRAQTKLGDVGFDKIACFDALSSAGGTQLGIIVAGIIWCYDGTTLSQVAFPDDQLVSGLFAAGSRMYYQVRDSGVWYFSDLDDITSIDGLAFATADASPDATVGLAGLGDEIVFFGQDSVEFWRQTGDQDGPLARTSGATYDKGCAAQGSIVAIDNRVLFVGSDLQVYATDTGPDRVSTHGIEEDLRKCTTPEDIRAFKLLQDGHWLYVLNIPGGPTHAYDLSTQTWGPLTSYGRAGWRILCGVTIGGVTYLGDDTTGIVFTYSSSAFVDDGDPIERVASCFVQASDAPMLVAEFALHCAVGVGPADGSDVFVDLRYSDDKGRTWSTWRARSLGRMGQYDIRPSWKNLGQIKRGRLRLFEVRSTAAAQINFAGAEVN